MVKKVNIIREIIPLIKTRLEDLKIIQMSDKAIIQAYENAIDLIEEVLRKDSSPKKVEKLAESLRIEKDVEIIIKKN